MAQPTKDWQLYEAGKRYNNALKPSYYETVDANIDFFAGNQWRNLPDSDMPKPVFNILKRVIQFFVASLTTSRSKLHFEPMMYNKENPDPARQNDVNGAEIANKTITALLDKLKMDFKVKKALFDAAKTGDACAHFYFDVEKKPYGSYMPNIKGEICMEMVDGTNIMFGNANNPSAENQPYIIVVGRDMVRNLNDEAKLYKNKGAGGDVTEDSNRGWQAGEASRIEVDGTDEGGKATYIIVYRMNKKTKTVWKSKSVESSYIYQDIDTGLSVYPIAWMNWEAQENQYHGRAVATGILPNQIFINRMFAMAMYHLMHAAFPKAVYNADVIDQFNDAVGESIGVEGVSPEMPLGNIATYLKPGDMSAQITQVIDFAMQYTKETMGVSDAGMGNIDPKNTSATIAVQKASAIPLEIPKSNLYEWIEDIGHILLDMMGTYYGPRPVMGDDGTLQLYDFKQFKNLWLEVTADVGESGYWSEIAASQTLDNLLAQQQIDFVQYLERQPSGVIPQKDELIKEVKERIQAQQQAQQAQQAAMQQQQEQAAQQAQAAQAVAAQQEQAKHAATMQSADQKFQHAAKLKEMDIAGNLAMAELKAGKHK